MKKWRTAYTTYFRKDYDNLKENENLIKEIDISIKKLSDSNRPQQLGIPKSNNLKGIYSFEIGQQYRILYEVFNDKKVIVFYKVGLHNIYESKFKRLRSQDLKCLNL